MIADCGDQIGAGSDALFCYPFGVVAVDSTVYVADTGNNKIKAYSYGSASVTLFAGSTDGSAGQNDGVGTLAQFSAPRPLASDGDYLYTFDFGYQRIRKIEIASSKAV
jgi:hypothetical protein